jgi:hypothetical protein
MQGVAQHGMRVVEGPERVSTSHQSRQWFPVSAKIEAQRGVLLGFLGSSFLQHLMWNNPGNPSPGTQPPNACRNQTSHISFSFPTSIFRSFASFTPAQNVHVFVILSGDKKMLRSALSACHSTLSATSALVQALHCAIWIATLRGNRKQQSSGCARCHNVPTAASTTKKAR